MEKNKDTNAQAAPKVKLVAEMPGDEEMRESLDEMRLSDGYPGSCGIGAAEPEQEQGRREKQRREDRVSGFEQCRELE